MDHESSVWHSRGYLPHFDQGEITQSITYRLYDALPAKVVAQLEEQAFDDPRRRELVDRWLDAGHGAQILRRPGIAKLVVRAWHYFDGSRYRLHAWCVMPTHVHVLITPVGPHTLRSIMHSQKSYTAKAILAQFPGSADVPPAFGPKAGETPAVPGSRSVWHADYFDRFIRDASHYRAAVDYIHQNPVKAGLVRHAVDWPWSSAKEWDCRTRECGHRRTDL